MKNLKFGLVWQIMGFLGAIAILCTVAPLNWGYPSIAGIVDGLLGTELMIPFVVCIVIFIVGSVFCYKGLREK